MSQYTQLTQEQRYQIYAFMKAGFSQTDISSEIGVNKSTISRELKRNRGQKGYRPKQAHTMTVERRGQADKFVKMRRFENVPSLCLNSKAPILERGKLIKR